MAFTWARFTNTDVVWSLKDALARSASRVIDLFIEWDEDSSGTISRKEFRKAIRAFGFGANNDELDAVFSSFDVDGGTLMHH